MNSLAALEASTLAAVFRGPGKPLELSQRPTPEFHAGEALCDRDFTTLNAAGAHFILESVADLPELLPEIDRRAVAGERPF